MDNHFICLWRPGSRVVEGVFSLRLEKKKEFIVQRGTDVEYITLYIHNSNVSYSYVVKYVPLSLLLLFFSLSTSSQTHAYLSNLEFSF
jgi:hypothetical protein